MEKLLTVSIAAYNAENWLSKCLDSFCIPEVMGDMEVLIINDGSTDNTWNVGRAYQDRYPATFRLIDKENGGHGSTINSGIRSATGKYFKLVDADDWVEEDGLIDLVKKLKSLDVDAVISSFYRINAATMDKTLISACGKKRSLLNREIEVQRMDSSCDACIHSLTFRTELLREHYIPIDEHCFFVDLEYDAFYFSRVRTVYLSDIPVYDYLTGTSFQSVNVKNKVRRREQHLRMTRHLTDFYEARSGDNSMPFAAEKVIQGAVISQYGLLFQIPDEPQSLLEIKAWEEELKTASPRLYRQAIRHGIRTRKETALMVALLRLLRFHGYGLVHCLYARKDG